MSIYTEEYRDSIEFDNEITTKKGCCILVIFTDAAERKVEFISGLKYGRHGSDIIDLSGFIGVK